MAAAQLLPFCLLVLLFFSGPQLGQANRSGDRRFAELKRCADEECSMLMYRGRALEDFTGPDCRFVNFKEGEAVYVYYKLVGTLPELWAGSVGSVFGYFPKDLIEVNHQYSEQEQELPTDETDFVCFDGGTDDFDNYDVEDLLGFLGETLRGKGEDELNTSGIEGSENPIEEMEEENPEKLNIEKPPEVSKDDEPETAMDSKVLANSEENNLPSENTKNLEEEFETQMPPVHVNSHVDNPHGNQPSLEPLEEMLQDKLKVPESENAKNINTSQLSKDWEEIDAYKLLKKEMNLDLKTKFGSTADALVSDDETTRLVTSLEDEFDGELDVDDSKVEEEDKENFDEPPLLTFSNGEDRKTSVNTVVEKYSTGESLFPEEDTDEVVQPRTGEKNDKNILKTLGDTIFSIVGGGEEDATDLDGSDLDEEKEEDNEKVLTGKWEEDSTFLTIEVPVTNHDKNLDDTLEIATVTGIKEKSEKIQSYKEEFPKDGMELVDKDSAIKSPIPEIDLKLNPMEGDLKESIVHQITKEELHEEKSGQKVLYENLESDPVHKTLWKKMKEKNTEQKSVNIKSLLEDEQQNASKGNVDIRDISENEQEQEMFSEKIQGKQATQPAGLKTQYQVNISSEDQTDLPREKVEENLKLEGNILSQQEKDVETEINKQLDEKTKLSEGEIQDQFSKDRSKVMKLFSPDENLNDHKEMESAQNKDKDIPKEREATHFKENVGQPLTIGTTDFQTEKAEAEDDDFPNSEDLLEDENAISAAASGQSSRLDVDVQMRKATSGVTNLMHSLENTKEKTSMILENQGIGSLQGSIETTPKEVIEKDGEPVKISIKEQGKNPLEKNENEKNAFSEFLDKDKNQAQDLVEETNYFEKEDGLKNKIDFSFTEKSWPDELSQEDLEHSQNFTEEESQTYQQSDFIDLEDNLAYKNALESEDGDTIKQLPIIKGFLDEKRVERLEKYLGSENMLQMESTFRDMERKLERAQRESLAYNMEKALDDVFRSSESNILDMVEKMLDSRAAENKELGMKEIDLFDEESALLDDIQDLIYFVRYKHPLVEESVPLAAIEPPEEISRVPLTVFPVDQKIEPRGVQGRKFAVNEEDTFAPEENKRPPENMEIKVLKVEEPDENLDISEKDGLLDSKEIIDVSDSQDGLLVIETLPDQNVEDLARGMISTEDIPLDLKQLPLEIISTEDAPLDTEQHPLGMISVEDTPLHTEQLETNPEIPPVLAAMKSISLVAKENMKQYTEMLVATLPEDIRPGPDFHGLPWEPIIITALLGIGSFAIFFWRTFLSVKSRVYQVNEKQLAEKIKTLLQEKTEILEKMSEYDHKIKKAKESVKETKKQNINLSDEAADLKDTIKGLEETNQKLDDKVKNLHSLLETEKEQNVKKQDMILETQKSIEKLQEVITMHSVELSEVQIALNEAKLSEEKVKSELHHVQEENARLKKRKEQLLQEAEGWSERHTELSEQIRLYQKTQKDTEEALAYKENEIDVLTNCIMQLKQLDLDSESEGKNNEEGNGWDDLANGEVSDKITSDNRNEKMKIQIKQMMDVSRVKTTLTIVEEDRNHLQSKLSDEIKARHELEEQIKKLEHDSSSLHSAKAHLENECKTLQQKVEILNELYQQKEMALQKKLTQEEYERQEKEQKLTAADEKASLVAEEVKTYKQRIQEMEDELQKTERSYKNQIASHEKKAHDNWLIARAAERALAEEKREAANLRQKLIEVNQKIAMLQRPMIVKPTPGRPDHQIPPRRGPLSRDGSFGPSPVSGGAPSPPLMMEPPLRSISGTLNRRDVSRSEFGSMDGPPLGPGPRRSSEVSGRTSASDIGPGPVPLMNSGPRSSSPSTVLDGMVNTGPKGHPPFPGMPLMSPIGPPPPPLRYGPPPPLRASYGPRPLPPPLVPGGPPPPSFREYLHGLPPGIRDLPPDPREYIRGHPPFGPLGPPGPREYLPPGPRLPPPAHGRDYPPPPFSRDLTPSGSRDYAPSLPHPPHASQGSTQDYAQAPEQSP
ncbi:transport and Golgi organization protein 1 homolog isoform X2 [Monodelphis domestica]|uniref:transport and Golgi organization protein 1 homolog isoform X2 n=1 Tax=Monodelphis domestica TaxID=13616 RepID=UPI0024E1C0E2|nr:transport and Golgi organization protein 1 homolog isoform X2 [Monodelphis domestica]